MQSKENKIIKNKIEDLSDLDLYFDDTQLWERLEERLDKGKTKRLTAIWIWSAAAVVLITISLYLTIQSNKDTELAINATIEKAIENKSNPIENHRKITEKSLKKIDKKEKFETETIEKIPEFTQNIIAEESQKVLTQNLNPISNQGKLTEIAIESKAFKNNIQYKTENVTVMNLPIIPDELMKRESLGKRVFRQIKNFNTEGKIDWRELNIEPRNVWAYLERNFKYDTTKTVKQ